MRLSATEKHEIIRLEDGSELVVNKTLRELASTKARFTSGQSLPGKRSTRFGDGKEQPPAVEFHSRSTKTTSGGSRSGSSGALPTELAVKITDEQRVFISETSVYRILKGKGLITTPAHILLSASNEFRDKTAFVHQMWQTDFTYFKVLGWGWYYLSTVLDDYSRFIVHWELCKTMRAEDVQRTVDQAMAKANLAPHQRPKLLSDNGTCYIASELKDYLKSIGVKQVRGKLNHPQTQGKIERCHRSMKNVVKLDNYYLPEELNRALGQFVHYYNHQRYHESLDNITPADVYYGRKEMILKHRAKSNSKVCCKEDNSTL